MKTPPSESAGRAATRASATNAQNNTHVRGGHAGGESLKANPIGLSIHANTSVCFAGKTAMGGEPVRAVMRSGAPGRDKGAIDAPTPCAVDFGLRNELGILAAIAAFPSVLARFKALGVGPDVFSWPAIASLARFVMTWDRSEPLPVLHDHEDAMRDPLDGGGPNLGDELEGRVAHLHACPRGDEWAMRDLRNHLAALARLWLPAALRHLARMYEAGDTSRAERLVISLLGVISTTGGNS